MPKSCPGYHGKAERKKVMGLHELQNYEHAASRFARYLALRVLFVVAGLLWEWGGVGFGIGFIKCVKESVLYEGLQNVGWLFSNTTSEQSNFCSSSGDRFL